MKRAAGGTAYGAEANATDERAVEAYLGDVVAAAGRVHAVDLPDR